MNANFTKMDIKTRQEKKAVELVAQAEKKLKVRFWFGFASFLNARPSMYTRKMRHCIQKLWLFT